MMSASNSGSEPVSRTNHIPSEILIDRYLWDVAHSPSHIADLFPGLFYDKDGLNGKEFYERMRAVAGAGLCGVFRAENRFKKMEIPPLLIKRKKGRIITSEDIYNINRQFYNMQEFYQTTSYKQLHHLVTDRLKKGINIAPHLDIPLNEIGLNRKICNRLIKAGISNIEDLVQMTAWDLGRLFGLGRGSIYEIAEILDQNKIPHNVHFPNWLY